MPEFALNVLDIDESGRDFGFPVRRAWLASVLVGTDVRADDTAEDGLFRIHAHRQGHDIVLLGRLTSSLLTECARCLSDARISIDTPVSSLMTARVAESRPVPDELELTPEDLDREFYTGDRIVLDEIVREHLLLEVPIKPLCVDDCPGIAIPAPIAGRREPTGLDPRLAPLMKLVGKLEPTEE